MLRKAEGRWERWQVQGWKRKWTLGSNEFIQGGEGARGKSATLFGQDFANTKSMLLKHLSVWERKRETCEVKNGIGAIALI